MTKKSGRITLLALRLKTQARVNTLAAVWTDLFHSLCGSLARSLWWAGQDRVWRFYCSFSHRYSLAFKHAHVREMQS